MAAKRSRRMWLATDVQGDFTVLFLSGSKPQLDEEDQVGRWDNNAPEGHRLTRSPSAFGRIAPRPGECRAVYITIVS
ncbi:unnamed protein product [marine sediment metagenome]|uniref:Uncharacterized protein n=1 Tax=marine sediment metagenome TaxID=412755 RepID=X0STY5_9ZZZZ